MSSSLDLSRFMDELALAAAIACHDKVDRSQVNKLLEYVEAADSFTIMLFLARQVARGEWSKNSAARLLKVLMVLRNEVKDEGKLRDVLRRILGYFKWFFESAEKANIRIVLNQLSKSIKDLSQALRNPNAPAPQGFAEAYLKALLGVA